MLLKWFYNVAFLAGLVMTGPFYGYRMWRRGGWKVKFGERFGFYSADVRRRLRRLERPLWVHAVSVGEMVLAQVLIRELRTVRGDQAVVITTTTSTGREMGVKFEDERTVILHTPLDWFPVVRRFFRLVDPVMLLLMEQEIWPNFLWEAERRGVPVWLINARFSERSSARLKKFRRVLEPLFRRFAFIGVQHERELSRLAGMGFPPHVLFNTGSMKFDVAELGMVQDGLSEELRRRLGWGPEALVLFAGSTFRGEEEIFLDLYQKVCPEFPDLKLVLAPRHVERSSDICEACRRGGVQAVRRSTLNGKGEAKGADALVLDVTGELRSLYSMGTVTFIGKSLRGKGGQNFLEAARVGQAMVVGPEMENFRYWVEVFRKEGGLEQVKDDAELGEKILAFLRDPERRRATGSKAKEIFQRELGAARRTAGMVAQALRAQES